MFWSRFSSSARGRNHQQSIARFNSTCTVVPIQQYLEWARKHWPEQRTKSIRDDPDSRAGLNGLEKVIGIPADDAFELLEYPMRGQDPHGSKKNLRHGKVLKEDVMYL